MKLKVVVWVMACFLMLSLVSATAKIQINSIPNHELFITEIDAYSGSSNTPSAQPFSTFTGEEGILVLDYTPKKSIFKLGLLLKSASGMPVIKYYVFDDDDELMHDDKFINITFLKDEKSVVEGEIPVETDESSVEDVIELNISEETLENGSEELVITNGSLETEDVEAEIIISEDSEGMIKGVLVSGHAVYEDNKSILTIVSYIIVGAVALFVCYKLFFGKVKGLLKGKKGSSVPDTDDDDEDALKKAEEDLKRARERIEELKGKKVSAARQKLIEDEKELMRLRKLDKD